MDLNYIMQQTHVITNNLIANAKEMCSNQFSSKIFYVIVYDKEFDSCTNFHDRQKKMINSLIKGKLLNEKEIALKIAEQQENLSWIDFELFHTSIVTVIMTIFVSKEKYHNDLQFHSCFTIPPWTDKYFSIKDLPRRKIKTVIWRVKYKNYLKTKKFDINWQFMSWSARWKIFWWQHKIRFAGRGGFANPSAHLS